MSIKINKNDKSYPVGVIPKNVIDDVTELKSEVFPTAYSTDGLTFTDCTFHSGGYFKIGKLVVLNLRIKITTGTNTTKQYVGLPNSIKSKVNSVALVAENVSNDENPIFAFISQGNILYLNNTVSNKYYAISGMWLI